MASVVLMFVVTQKLCLAWPKVFFLRRKFVRLNMESWDMLLLKCILNNYEMLIVVLEPKMCCESYI